MTKKEMIDAIVQKLSWNIEIPKAPNRKTIEAIYAYIFEVIQDMPDDDKVSVINFGTFKKVKKPAHKAKNPFTGKMVDVPEKTVLKFKASK